jgi:hypothetical protein
LNAGVELETGEWKVSFMSKQSTRSAVKLGSVVVGASISIATCLAIACNGPGTAAPSTSCEILGTCCARMTGANRTTCDSTVSVGLNSTCLAALVSYEATTACEGEDGGADDDAGDAARADVETVDPDPCGTLAGCCGAFPPGSQCSIAVGSKNATLCAQELANGDCDDSGAP